MGSKGNDRLFGGNKSDKLVGKPASQPASACLFMYKCTSPAHDVCPVRTPGGKGYNQIFGENGADEIVVSKQSLGDFVFGSEALAHALSLSLSVSLTRIRTNRAAPEPQTGATAATRSCSRPWTAASPIPSFSAARTPSTATSPASRSTAKARLCCPTSEPASLLLYLFTFLKGLIDGLFTCLPGLPYYAHSHVIGIYMDIHPELATRRLLYSPIQLCKSPLTILCLIACTTESSSQRRCVSECRCSRTRRRLSRLQKKRIGASNSHA